MKTLYWNEQGAIGCERHIPHKGSDTWNWERWVEVTSFDKIQWHKTQGSLMVCEICTNQKDGPANYEVNLWGSFPKTNAAFKSKEAAMIAYNQPEKYFRKDDLKDTVFIEICGPDLREERRIGPDAEPVSDEDWKWEQAMEARMLHGCNGYNEQVDR